jgi:hypothetical protein
MSPCPATIEHGAIIEKRTLVSTHMQELPEGECMARDYWAARHIDHVSDLL